MNTQFLHLPNQIFQLNKYIGRAIKNFKLVLPGLSLITVVDLYSNIQHDWYWLHHLKRPTVQYKIIRPNTCCLFICLSYELRHINYNIYGKNPTFTKPNIPAEQRYREGNNISNWYYLAHHQYMWSGWPLQQYTTWLVLVVPPQMAYCTVQQMSALPGSSVLHIL